ERSSVMRHYRWLVFVAMTLAVLLAGGVAALTGGAHAQQPRTAGSGPAQGTPTPVCGGSWTVVNSPSPGLLDNILYGVDALTSKDVWAVGSAYGNDGREGTLTEHWDGSAWSIVASPTAAGNGDNHLYSISALASNDVWAVGQDSPSGLFPTLA